MDAAADASTKGPGVAELAAELGSDALALYRAIDLPRQLEEHPVRTLLLAAGVGYVAGGGLFTPLTSGLLRLGLRAAMLPAVQAAILRVPGSESAPEDLVG